MMATSDPYFNLGAEVEASGDPNDEGFRSSWWEATVVGVRDGGRVFEVEYEELLEDDAVTKSKEWLPAARIRGKAPDDSFEIPVAERQSGDAVDCRHDDGWWEGYVHTVWDDHISVYFPLTDEIYDDIFEPTAGQGPGDPAHRVRTGYNWPPSQRMFVPRRRKLFPGAANERTRPAEASGSLSGRGAQSSAAKAKAKRAALAVSTKRKASAPAPATAAAKKKRASKGKDAAASEAASGRQRPGSPSSSTLPKVPAEAGSGKGTSRKPGKAAKAAQQKRSLAATSSDISENLSLSAQPSSDDDRAMVERSTSEQGGQEGEALAYYSADEGPEPGISSSALTAAASNRHAPSKAAPSDQPPSPEQAAAPAGEQVDAPPSAEASRRLAEILVGLAGGHEAGAPAAEDDEPLGKARKGGKQKLHISRQKPFTPHQKGADGPRVTAHKLGAAPAAPPAAAAAPAPVAAPVPADAAPKPAPMAARAAGFVIPKKPATEERHGFAAAAAAAPKGRPKAAAQPGAVLCLDNLGSGVTSEALAAALHKHLTGVTRVSVVAVPLDGGSSHAGYAVLEFASAAAATSQRAKLNSLCLLNPYCPVPRPLLAHEPRITSGYAWGEGPFPGHILDRPTSPHFVQPNSLEFDLALDWRLGDEVAAQARERLCQLQAQELAQVMGDYLKETGQDGPPTDAAQQAPAPPSRCLWVKAVGPGVLPPQMIQTFSQFGFVQKVTPVRDPVTGQPSGHVVVTMETPARAAAVAKNLNEMIFVLGGTPRPLQVEVARPGPPRGSQSVFDRAVRAAFGGGPEVQAGEDAGAEGSSGGDDQQPDEPAADVELVLVPDSALTAPGSSAAQRAAVRLRALLWKQGKEQDAARAVASKERLALAERQRVHFAKERDKLTRLDRLQASPLFAKLKEIHNVTVHAFRGRGVASIQEN